MSNEQPDTRENLRGLIRTIIAGQCFAAPLPQVLINGGVFSLLIILLGGSKFEVGMVFTIQFVSQITRVFAARHVDVRNRKWMVIRWALISNILFLLIFTIEPIRVNLGNRVAMWAAIGVFFLQRLAIHRGMTAFNPMIADLLPAPLRGRFFGAMRGTFQITSLVVIVAAGTLLGDEPSFTTFYIVFAAMLLASFVRPFLFLRLPEPNIPKRRKLEPFIKNIARPFKDIKFRRFLLFWAYLVFALNLGRPFTVPYMKQDLDFPSSITIYASSLLVLGMAVSLVQWGRLADRLGNRLVFLLTIILVAVSMIMLAFVPHYDAAPLTAIVFSVLAIALLGVAIGGLGIAHTVRTMHVAPERYRGSYMGAFFVTNGVVAAITSSAAGYMLDHVADYIRIGGQEIAFMRIYFPLVGVLILCAVFILKNLTPIYERSIRESVAAFAGSLPTAVTLPLQAIRSVLDRSGKGKEEGSTNDTNK